MTIETVITLTKVAYAIETQVIALALQDLIVQQIEKNAIHIPNVVLYHIISINAILH